MGDRKLDEKPNIDDSIRQIKNILLTGSADKDFKLESDADDQYGSLKQSMKEGKLDVIKGFCFLAVFAFLSPLQAAPATFSYMGNTIGKILGTIITIVVLLIQLPFLGIAIYFFYKAYTAHKKNKEIYEQTVVAPAIQELLPGAQFQADKYFSVGLLKQWGIVPSSNESSGSYLIDYTKGREKFGFSNLRLERVSESEDGKSSSTTVFNGQIYGMNFKSDIQGSVRMISTRKSKLMKREIIPGYEKKRSQEVKVETENQLFNEEFAVFATNEEAAFYVLSPYVMEQLLAMKRRYAQFGVAVVNDTVVLALNTNMWLFGMPSSYNAIEGISIERSKAEFAGMLDFANALRNSLSGNTKENFTTRM